MRRFLSLNTRGNIVDYSRVENPAALNRWAGNRVIVLAFVAALLIDPFDAG